MCVTPELVFQKLCLLFLCFQKISCAGTIKQALVAMDVQILCSFVIYILIRMEQNLETGYSKRLLILTRKN
jgi:hypothetical protein